MRRDAAAMPDYQVHRLRVEAARERMRLVVARPHPPAVARLAAAELEAALAQARQAVLESLRAAEAATSADARRRTPPSGDRRRWIAELVRLASVDQWLRRVTLDDPGVRFATTVRVGSRAASGPHVAGLEAEPRDLVAATLHEPRIGVDLRALVDGACGTTEAPRCHKR